MAPPAADIFEKSLRLKFVFISSPYLSFIKEKLTLFKMNAATVFII
jgi:hypothetical protein